MTFLDEQLRRLNEKRLNIMQAMASGQPKDYAEYREMVGHIRGVNDAIFDAEAIQKQWEDSQ